VLNTVEYVFEPVLLCKESREKLYELYNGKHRTWKVLQQPHGRPDDITVGARLVFPIRRPDRSQGSCSLQPNVYGGIRPVSEYDHLSPCIIAVQEDAAVGSPSWAIIKRYYLTL
jgi:hypothetical protein